MAEHRNTNHNSKMGLAQWMVVITDILLINGSFTLGYVFRYELQLFRAVDPVNYVPYSAYLGLQVGYTIVLIATLKFDGAWTLRRSSNWLDEVYSIINGTTTGMAIVLVIIFGIRPLAFSRLLLLYVSVLTVIFLSSSRLIKRSIDSYQRRRGIGVARTIIVGAGEVGMAVMRTLVARPDMGYKLVGYVESGPNQMGVMIGRFHRLGGLDNLAATLAEHNADEVIITLPSDHNYMIQRVIRQCHQAGVRARIVPDFFQMSLSQVDIDYLAGIPLIGVREPYLGRGPRLVKRVIDVVFSLAALIVSSPVLLIVGLAIRLDSEGPVFFQQERLGEKERSFKCVKFRSMREGAEAEQEALRDLNEADGPLFKIKDDPRLTRVGRFIRRTSLDEFPQFINVLRGEMSLVGPRPPVPSEVVSYKSWQRKRLAVKPGLSGLWQVSGRSDLTFDEMCLLDIYYIENWSLWLDVRIILRTIPQFFFGRGAY
ncbi:MAG: sugar transferase [Anaerolineales bacterium]|nr:sugar transferase [Anaerolineales bacterium]